MLLTFISLLVLFAQLWWTCCRKRKGNSPLTPTQPSAGHFKSEPPPEKSILKSLAKTLPTSTLDNTTNDAPTNEGPTNETADAAPETDKNGKESPQGSNADNGRDPNDKLNDSRQIRRTNAKRKRKKYKIGTEPSERMSIHGSTMQGTSQLSNLNPVQPKQSSMCDLTQMSSCRDSSKDAKSAKKNRPEKAEKADRSEKAKSAKLKLK